MMHRVLLLLLTTGLFAVVWSNDQPRDRAAGETLAASRTGKAVATSLYAAADAQAGAARNTRDFPNVTVATNASVFTSACFADDLSPRQPVQSAAGAPIAAPRPRDIVDLNRNVPLVLGGAIPDPGPLAAGVYHLVSSRGDVYQIAVRGTNLDDPASERTGTAAMRMVAAHGVRWYFIRIEDRAGPLVHHGDGDARLAAGTAVVWMGSIVRRSGAAVAAGLDNASRNVATNFRRAGQTLSRRLDALRRFAADGAGRLGEAMTSFLSRMEQARQAAAERSGGRRS